VEGISWATVLSGTFGKNGGKIAVSKAKTERKIYRYEDGCTDISYLQYG